MIKYIKLLGGSDENTRKTPIEKWRQEEFQYPKEVARHFSSVGVPLNEEWFVVDADSADAQAKIEEFLKRTGIKALSYATDRGKHYWFKDWSERTAKGTRSNISALIERQPSNPSMFKSSKIDSRDSKGQIAIKLNDKWRITPEELESGLNGLESVPVALYIDGNKIKVSIYDYPGSGNGADDFVFKNWLPKFRSNGLSEKEFIKFVVEAAKFHGDKESDFETASWAKAKWDSSLSMGEIKQVKFHGNQYSKEEINWGEIANTYIDQFGLVKINEIVMNKDGKYIKEMEIKNAIANDFPQKPATFADAVFDKIDQLLKNKDDIFSESYIYFQNGRFDINEGKFEEGEYESFNKMPWKYVEDAKSSYGETLLRRFEGDNKGFATQIFEAVGMLASKKMLFKKTIFFDGPSNFGKSVLTADVIAKAIGEKNLTRINLVNMDNQENAKLMGKTGALDDDMEKESWNSNVKANFKKITGSEMITGKFLFRDKFDFVNYATLMINCNGLPKANDNGSGGSIENRMHIIKATVNMQKLYPNPNIYNELDAHRQEISEWLLSNACRAIHEALKAGKLTITEASKEEQMQFKYDNSTVFKWLIEEVQEKKLQFNTKADAYVSYVDSFEMIPGKVGSNYGSKAKNNQESFVNALVDFKEDFGYELEVKLGKLKLTWKEQN